MGRHARPNRFASLAPSLAVSAVLHGVLLGTALGPWSGGDSAPGGTPRLVLIDLAMSGDATPAGPEPAPRGDDPATLSGRVAALDAENRILASSLAAEQRERAQLEAEHEQRIAALDTARSALGDELAAVAAARAALSTEAAASRERAAALEAELRARDEAEQAALAEARATYDRLVASLRDEIDAKDIALEQANERLTVAIVDRVLFPSGRAALTAEGRAVIDKVAAALARASGRRVLIEGHTDNVPIGPELASRFPSNWELSTARATEVVKRLIEDGLPGARLSAAGRADTEPVAANDTETGRRRNRRIEIILLPPRADAPS